MLLLIKTKFLIMKHFNWNSTGAQNVGTSVLCRIDIGPSKLEVAFKLVEIKGKKYIIEQMIY